VGDELERIWKEEVPIIPKFFWKGRAGKSIEACHSMWDLFEISNMGLGL
jgi:hypothetical protein